MLSRDAASAMPCLDKEETFTCIESGSPILLQAGRRDRMGWDDDTMFIIVQA